MLEKIYVENFKTLDKLELDFNDDLNIIVGDNETGKSTLLEAISMALTGQLYGRYIASELSPYLFNKKAVENYIKQLHAGKNVKPPHILIELYLKETPETAKLKGTNNTARENATGVTLKIEFDDNYKLVGIEIEIATNGFMVRYMYENPEMQKYEKVTARSIDELVYTLKNRLEA